MPGRSNAAVIEISGPTIGLGLSITIEELVTNFLFHLFSMIEGALL
jgi:hypothetical protein